MTNLLLKKKEIFIGIWLVFSLLYIAYDQWYGFKVGIMQNYYNAGMTDGIAQWKTQGVTEGKAEMVSALLQQVQKSDCKPFNVHIDANSVDLIDVKCLTQGPTSTGTGASAQSNPAGKK